MNNKLNLHIPDISITIFFGLGWIAFVLFLSLNHSPGISDLFLNILKIPPLLFGLYLWIKAVIVDFIRIKRGEKMTMPGFTFWVYEMNYFAYWTITDLMNSSLMFKPNRAEVFLYAEFSTLFWIILETISSLLISPLKFLVGNKNLTVQSFLVLDLIRSVGLVMAFSLISLLFG